MIRAQAHPIEEIISTVSQNLTHDILMDLSGVSVKLTMK